MDTVIVSICRHLATLGVDTTIIRVIAQAAGRRSPVAGRRFITAEARIQSQSFRYGICGERILKVDARFLRVHRFSLVSYSSTNFPFSHLLCGAGTVGSFAAEKCQGTHLTPPQE
jgi:hypothetical protein